MACSHRRTRLTVVLLVALLLAAAAAAAACSAQATAGSSSLTPDASQTQGGSDAAGETPAGDASGSATGGAAKAASGADWTRILNALGYMQAVTPTQPVVVLLGGSAARESTISDSSWRDQIVAKGGPSTLAWNMGSRNRSMAQNVAIVKKLPKGIRAIVYIGINLGSFAWAQKTATITLPSPLPTTSPTLNQPHQYSTETGILSTARKKALVRSWLADRYPVFKRNFGSSAGVLETLIKVCQARGYKPVLFELPRDTAVIGSSLSVPTTRFREKCKALATKYEIPRVSLVSAARRAQLQLLRPLAPGGAGPQDVAGPAQREDRGPAQAVRLRWRRLVTRPARAPAPPAPLRPRSSASGTAPSGR